MIIAHLEILSSGSLEEMFIHFLTSGDHLLMPIAVGLISILLLIRQKKY